MDINALRTELKVVQDLAYFQTGTLGPVPDAAMRAAHADMIRVNDAGPAYLPHRAPVMARIETARAELGRLLGCSPDALGFTQNTSQSINLVALSLDWQPGDEVIITDQEHPANIVPWRLLQERRGIRVVVVPAGNAAALPDLTSRAVGPHTRLISLCHVSALTGAVLPLAEICALARSQSIPTLVDGAQAVGVLPVNLQELDCDFYAGSGHKWLLGLPGIGYLYVRSDRLTAFRPFWAGPGSGDIEAGHVTWAATMRKIEIGTRDFAVLASLTESLAFACRAGGIAAISRRVAGLREMLRAELAVLPAVQVLTPSAPPGAAGLTTFRLEDGRDAALVDFLLHRHRVLVKLTKPTLDSVRVSTHFFNTESEVHRLVHGLREFLATAT